MLKAVLVNTTLLDNSVPMNEMDVIETKQQFLHLMVVIIYIYHNYNMRVFMFFF